jgi:hypothetical protein
MIYTTGQCANGNNKCREEDERNKDSEQCEGRPVNNSKEHDQHHRNIEWECASRKKTASKKRTETKSANA